MRVNKFVSVEDGKIHSLHSGGDNTWMLCLGVLSSCHSLPVVNVPLYFRPDEKLKNANGVSSLSFFTMSRRGVCCVRSVFVQFTNTKLKHKKNEGE